MQLLILTILLSFSTSLIRDMDSNILQEYKNDFQMWKKEFKTIYSSQVDYEYRLSVFIANKKEVDLHNLSNSSYKKGLNIFADTSDEEFMATFSSNHEFKIFPKSKPSVCLGLG